jgi:hypothetical protein
MARRFVSCKKKMCFPATAQCASTQSDSERSLAIFSFQCCSVPSSENAAILLLSQLHSSKLQSLSHSTLNKHWNVWYHTKLLPRAACQHGFGLKRKVRRRIYVFGADKKHDVAVRSKAHSEERSNSRVEYDSNTTLDSLSGCCTHTERSGRYRTRKSTLHAGRHFKFSTKRHWQDRSSP